MRRVPWRVLSGREVEAMLFGIEAMLLKDGRAPEDF